MKNSQIHVGFPNSELRDFLSFALVKNFEEEVNNKPAAVVAEDGMDYAISDAARMVNYFQRQLAILKDRRSILGLTKMQGWEEFDVSNETDKDSHFLMYANFIGTEAEYKQLMGNIKKEVK